MAFERAGETLSGKSEDISLLRKVGPRFAPFTPEQLPPGSMVRLSSYNDAGMEVISTVNFDGPLLPAYTPTPTPIPPTPTPTATPRPTLRATLPTLSGYSPLLAQAATNLPANRDFVRDGLSAEERNILDWADPRLFRNENFLASKWGPDNWPAEVKTASVQGILLLLMEIDIHVRADARHVVSWEVDSLDRVLDDLTIHPDLCVHCYGKTGYDVRKELRGYTQIVFDDGHVHREMLKTFAYLARADGEGILVRSFLENDANGLELLYKRKIDGSATFIAVGSFAYGNVSFMSQIRLPEAMPGLGLPAGALVSYPTMAFAMVGNVDTERQAVENIFDYTRKRLKHFSGDLNDFADHYRPHTVTPYAPELASVLYVGEAGSPSSSAVVTGLARAVGLKAEQFNTARMKFNAGFVEADGFKHHYDGNNVFTHRAEVTRDVIPLCLLMDRTYDNVENREYNEDCDK